MNKNYFLLFILLSLVSYSQTDIAAKTDSVKKLLAKSKPDTTRVNLLLRLARYSTNACDYKQSYDYALKAEELSKNLSWKKGLAESYCYMGDSYLSINYKQAVQYYEKALSIAKESGDEIMMAKLYDMLATQYSGDEYGKSLQYFEKALGLYKKLNDNIKYNNALIQLGYVYKLKGSYYKAADCYMEVIANGERSNNIKRFVNAYSLLAEIYSILGNYEKALEYYNKELKIRKKYKESYLGLGQCEVNIGIIYKHQQKYKDAFTHLFKALEYSKKSTNLQLEIGTLIYISDTYKETGAIDKANKYLDLASALKDDPGHNMWSKMRACVSLGQTAFSLKNYEQALQYHLESLELSEQLSVAEESAIANGNIGATYVRMAKAADNDKNKIAVKGIEHLQKAVGFLKSSNNIANLETYTYFLYEGYEVIGQSREALKTYKEYIAYRDSIFNRSKRDEFNAKQMNYEYGKKEALLKADQLLAVEREQTMRNISFGGVGVLLILAGGAGIAYRRKRRDNTIIAKEKKRSDDLLLNILPHEVAEELKQKGEAAAHYHEHVSILFTDFEGFTQISGKMSPKELITELNYCFKTFDQIITKYNIEKIKTIGDAYMAVSGLHSSSPDHALNVVRAAIEIRDFILDYKEQRKREGKIYFEMRIGINSGEVVAGIVGIKKFAYDIWGDAVNIAARMESNGVTGKINISESTYQLVKKEFDTEYRGEIEAKGKGKTKMYFVEPKKV